MTSVVDAVRDLRLVRYCQLSASCVAIYDHHAVRDLRLVRYCQLSASCVAIYDHLITIDQERRKWTLPKAMFLIVGLDFSSTFRKRCLTSLAESLRLCSSALSRESGDILTCAIIEALMWQLVHDHDDSSSASYIMRIRVVAMYGNSSRVASFLSLCFLAEVIAIFTILGLVSVREGGLPICGFESILFAFALWKGLSLFFSSGEKWSGGTLSILMACVASAAVWLARPSTWLGRPEGYVVATYSVMGSRLMLNTRDVYYLPVSQVTGPISTMRFASNGVGHQSHRGDPSSTAFADSHCPSDIEMHQIQNEYLGNESGVSTTLSSSKDGTPAPV
ncbi:hypothetical protein JAAARDRAFT_47064 [Jaapia argillacea MUCL 33604]|uniref:DUF6533 domain-containing protein n=1 Tax=Jaapia argillacea MUCL 33604 TaxID=933084 RepID=A0A067Q5D4_9AGAM|nr:hypothetical protein JAAARDRAFT_47064 [Jaapia argillacea MUCL 33604]